MNSRKPPQARLREQDRVRMRPVLQPKREVVGRERLRRLPLLQPAVVAEHEHAVEEHRVVGHRDARLAARHGLHPLQAEAADVAP